ncbi:MAG: hypothetical protein GX675_00510 [Erysipelotrichaceae bacterium]|nr:hypothetical protein [Erysipelotrichaceae bacterium]
MSQQNVNNSEQKIDASELIKALDEIATGSSNLNEHAVSKIKEAFNKSYDPYTPLENIAPIIDEADKQSDLSSLGIAGIFASFTIMFLLLPFTYYSYIISVISNFLFLGIFISSIIVAVSSSNKLKKAQNELRNLRITYFDKELLTELLNDRKKKSSVGKKIFAVLSFFAIFLLVILDLAYLEDFGVFSFFLFITIGSFIMSRTSQRFKTIQKVLSTTQQ